MPSVRGGRLGGRVFERRFPAPGKPERPPKRADRAVGAQISALRQAWPADRLLAGVHSLVGSMAQMHRHRHHGGADAQGVDAGSSTATALLRRATGTMDRREIMAIRQYPPGASASAAEEPGQSRAALNGGQGNGSSSANGGAGGGKVVFLRDHPRPTERSTGGRGRAAFVRLRGA